MVRGDTEEEEVRKGHRDWFSFGCVRWSWC